MDKPNPAEEHSPDIDLSSERARSALAKMVIKLFGLWGLSTADQLELLGLSPESESMLAKYANGEPLPLTPDMLDRVGWLMSIHKSLRILFPCNEHLCYLWVTRRNRAFDNRTALDIMKEQGVVGFAQVARYLHFYRER